MLFSEYARYQYVRSPLVEVICQLGPGILTAVVFGEQHVPYRSFLCGFLLYCIPESPVCQTGCADLCGVLSSK